MRRSEPEWEEVEVYVHKVTAKAMLVSQDEDRDNAVWLPLSQVNTVVEEESFERIEVARWLAEREGLI